MARIWESGFETNGFSEWTTSSFNISVVSTNKNNGAYSAKATIVGGNGGICEKNISSKELKITYTRFYFYIESSYDATDGIMIASSTIGSGIGGISLDTSNQLVLFDYGNSVQLGSSSTALTLNTWYLIELKVDMTTVASTSFEARLNSSVFASGTADETSTLGSGINQIYVGSCLTGAATTGGTFYFDDVATNDSTGSIDNSYSGALYTNYANVYRRQGFQ